MESLLFYVLSAIILGAALLMVTSRNMVHSVVWMVVCFVAIGALFILLQAEFVAAVQIMVYAGGIVVLFLFVVMLVNVGEIRQIEYLHRQWLPASILALLLAAELGFLVWGSGASVPTAPEQAETMLRGMGGNTETIGLALYRQYFFPFEIASVLLLVAMVGAIYLAKKRV